MGPLLLAAALLAPQAVDPRTNRPLADVTVTIQADPVAGYADIDARPADPRRATFHGRFAMNAIPAVVRLSVVSADDVHALEQLNRFRSQFGLRPLVIDENLTETARYWAQEERRSGRIGHTCVALGDPPRCIEFNAFFHRLPGAPQDWDSGQNAAFDPVPSWSDPDAGFEAERFSSSGERGHFLNLVSAKRWIGFGEVSVPGTGSYFAMNVL
jgi:hypothetical protein